MIFRAHSSGVIPSGKSLEKLRTGKQFGVQRAMRWTPN
jgi:hypothetical protein